MAAKKSVRLRFNNVRVAHFQISAVCALLIGGVSICLPGAASGSQARQPARITVTIVKAVEMRDGVVRDAKGNVLSKEPSTAPRLRPPAPQGAATDPDKLAGRPLVVVDLP
ncbi:MAG: hypothetical protein WBO17_09725 [Sphingorhabdus sp.]